MLSRVCRYLVPAQFKLPQAFAAAAWGLAVAAGVVAMAPAPAFAGDLQGSWSGGGTMSLASGKRERVRCRVTYSRKSQTTYLVSAVCASPSGRSWPFWRPC